VTRITLGIPPTAKVLVHVARFATQKRQILSLETTARLREALGDVRIVFAGNGPQISHVREAAREQGADWAIFLGEHDNVPSLFALSDLAILPSSGEAMPMAIVEAIAIGVPVVATEVGDVSQILKRTGAGICVPVHDAQAFYHSCREVLADATLYKRLAAAAADAAEQIDADAMAERYERVFEAVLDKRVLEVRSLVHPTG
jgi:glycosyltransferase involved in cell wall biosynthesis